MTITIDPPTKDASRRCENAAAAGVVRQSIPWEAFRLAHAFQPEFVLIDASLPDLSGYEVAAMLPGVVSSPRLRIASFSGYNDEGENRFSKAAGCVSHLRKPVDVKEIEELLARNGASMDFRPK